jgi:uncharacterized C2H2 Zn-finger protein
MSLLNCPKCDKVFRYHGDYEGFDNDSVEEFECPHCETEFLATVVYSIEFIGERLKENDEVEVDDETK